MFLIGMKISVFSEQMLEKDSICNYYRVVVQ